MSDPASEFCRLAVERGLVSGEVVQACLVKSKQNGESLPRLIAGEAGLNPEAARELYSEACRLAVGPDPEATLDCSLDKEENLIERPATRTQPPSSAGGGSSGALAALASSGFGRVPTLAPVDAPAEQTLVQAGSATDLSAVLRPGGELGGIRLEAELGRGAMGVVWRGLHLRLMRPVAIKILNPALTRDPKIRARFHAEALGVARLQHPNIVRVYDTSGPQESVAYFVMEYVQGQALSDALLARPFDPLESTRLIATIARAAHYAHTNGIVHRDLKPGNILLDGNGVPYLTDFGIAKHSDGEGLTQVGEVIGTPAYMSPEQAEGQGALVDARADVYALGAILYRMVTGQPPFVAPSSYEILNKVVNEDVLPPSRLKPVPAAVETAVLRALAKRREQRWPSALAFAEALEGALSQPAAPTSSPQPGFGSGFTPVQPSPKPAVAPAQPKPRPSSAASAHATAPSPAGAGGGSGGGSPGGGSGWTWILLGGVFCALALAGGLGFVAYQERLELDELRKQKDAEDQARLEEQAQADLDALAKAWGLRSSDPKQALAIAQEVTPRRADAFEGHALLGLLLEPSDERLAHLDRALEIQPQEIELLTVRAQTLVELGRIEDAEAAVSALSRLGDPGRVASLKIRGALALAEGAEQGAAIQFQEALKADPSDAELFVQVLELLIELRRYDSARKQAETFAEHHPRDARAFAWQARANQRLGRYSRAAEQAKQALELDAECELGHAVLKDLPKQLQQPVNPQPNPPQPQELHDRTHAALKAGFQALHNRDQQGARRAFQQAMQERALECVPAILERARLALAIGAPQVADQDLSSPAMSKADRKQVILALELHASAKARLQQPEAALKLFDRVVQLAPDNAHLIHERGHILEGLGQHERAQADLEYALELAPKNGHYWVTLGEILRGANKPDEARAAYKKALEESDPRSYHPGDQDKAKQALSELGGS